MKRFTILFFITLTVQGFGQINRKICISVDDLPSVEYRVKEEGHGWKITNGIIDAFLKHDAPAIGFVNAGKLFRDGNLDSTRVAYLVRWLENGFELGNHTFSHKNYHKVSFEEYAADILDGEKIVKELTERYSQPYRFFRHPYLRSGIDDESDKRLKEFLQANGYQEALVTVDDDDYLFALAYTRAYKKKDQEMMKKIGESYLQYMEDKLIYFEKVSIELFGRNINHTILIHANFLNSHYLDDLLTIYENLGYSFISQEEASSDPAYNTEVTKYGDWGISWIHKWGLSSGVKKDFFEEDPKTPDFIVELSR